MIYVCDEVIIFSILEPKIELSNCAPGIENVNHTQSLFNISTYEIQNMLFVLLSMVIIYYVQLFDPLRNVCNQIVTTQISPHTNFGENHVLSTTTINHLNAKLTRKLRYSCPNVKLSKVKRHFWDRYVFIYNHVTLCYMTFLKSSLCTLSIKLKLVI